MLVIISDLHLTDGTSGTTIDPNAFHIFRERLKDLAYAASDRELDGAEIYEPVKKIHLLLLGDIFDVIRSTRWLQDDNIRPWTEPRTSRFVQRVQDITNAIVAKNQEALAILRQLGRSGFEIRAHKTDTIEEAHVDVSIYYLVGNHDWFYHLEGDAFTFMRVGITNALGLANDPYEVFPHHTDELKNIRDVCRRHHVFARHGDRFDKNNYEHDSRDHSSLGDAVVIELVDRFAHDLEQLRQEAKRNGIKELTGLENIVAGLKEIDNVRPVELVPQWVDGLLKKNHAPKEVRSAVERTWNDVANKFLRTEFVRKHRWSTLKWGLRLSEGVSFARLRRIVPWGKSVLTAFGGVFPWFNNKLCRWGLSDGYYPYALTEDVFEQHNDAISYIVYGHTHRHEIVPLRAGTVQDGDQPVVYINSGTWRAVFDLARYRAKDEEFFGYHVMTYVAFFEGGERNGKAFETWSGSLEYPMVTSAAKSWPQLISTAAAD